MQFDIGFGDVIYPVPEQRVYPTLPDLPEPLLRCYPREMGIIAEKFEAMVSLGTLNSPLKDFYDVWLISRHSDFDGQTLAEAIRRTFEHRGTHVAGDVEAFGARFAGEKSVQWKAFRRRLATHDVPEAFDTAIVGLRSFHTPIARALTRVESFHAQRRAPGVRHSLKFPEITV